LEGWDRDKLEMPVGLRSLREESDNTWFYVIYSFL
jgi:hypothetical protein